MDDSNFEQPDESSPRLRRLDEGNASNCGNTTNNYYYQQAPNPPRKRGFLKVLLVLFLVLVLILLVVFGMLFLCAFAVGCISEGIDSLDEAPRNKVKEVVRLEGDSDDKVAVIDVKGIITRSKMSGVACSEKIVELIEHVADNSGDYRALVIDMDTPGGEVIAADEIHAALCKLKEKMPGMPIVTCMHSMGASGGYYVASATDYIIANRMTFTGSIGVIMSSYNISDLIGKIGVEEQVFRSGDMKDMMSPTRKMTEKERAYMQKMINDTFEEFAKIVANGRSAYETSDDVKKAPFGDGRVLSGAEALEYKLLDKLGGFSDAIDYVKAELKLEAAPRVVQLNNRVNFFDGLLDMCEKLPLQSRLIPGNAFAMKAGYLYYLMPSTAL